MPTTVFDGVVDAYCHCRDPRCRGYAQEEVKAHKVTVAISYQEQGGDAPGFEKSHDTLVFADSGDVECPTCGEEREVTAEPRPEYPMSSGQDPMMLLHIGKQEGRVRELEHAQELAAAQGQAEMAELKQLVAAQQAQLQQLLDKTTEEKPKRQPKEAA